MKLGGMYLWGSARRRAAAGIQPTVEDVDEDTSPLLVSRNVPIEDTPDRQLRNYVMSVVHYFDHWKHTSKDKQRSHTRILLTQLAGMLPAVRPLHAHAWLASSRLTDGYLVSAAPRRARLRCCRTSSLGSVSTFLRHASAVRAGGHCWQIEAAILK
jgi:hypothetical protein